MDIELQMRGCRVKVLQGPYTDNDAVTQDGLEFAERLVGDLNSYRAAAGEKLVRFYNDVWLDDEFGELSQEQISNLLVNPVVVVYDAIGAACIYFDDSNMFGGHGVELSIGDFELINVGIVG